jgi:hypothetical protein
MSKRQRGQSQEAAAAQAAISERSGRRIEKDQRLSIPGERHWRTREDPFETIWEKERVPLLGGCPRIENLLRKSPFGHIFRSFSLKSPTIRLK